MFLNVLHFHLTALETLAYRVMNTTTFNNVQPLQQETGKEGTQEARTRKKNTSSGRSSGGSISRQKTSEMRISNV